VQWRPMVRTTIAASAVILILALNGCATSKPVPLSNGRQGFVIDGCDSMAECYEKASETCGGGKYALIGQGGETIPIVSGGAGTFTATAVPQYNLTIECE
jgi:hypothetical protein